ncbi:MAG: DsbA family protein [Sandaracinaceae bacterium]
MRVPSEMSRLASLPVLLVASLAGCGAATPPPATAMLPEGPGPWAEASVDRVRVPAAGSPARGAADPLVTIVLFSDFQCSYCRNVRPVIDRLLEAYPDTVRVHFRHLPLPFHEHAELAAMATVEAREQAGDAGFWRMHDRLFEFPDALDVDNLIGHAAAIGLDAERMRIALRGRVHADVLEEDLGLADRAGADGTPTFFVNGRPVRGALPFEEFRMVVDRELDLARQAMDTGVPRARIYEAAMRDAMAEAPREPEPERERAPAPEGRRVLDPDAIYAVPVEGAPRMGPLSAPVTLVIFSDFECPFCRRVLPTLAALRERFPDQIRFVFRNNPLPFHPNAEMAAAAALEAFAQQGDEGFWAMHDRLFGEDASLRFDDLVSYASALGLDLGRFTAALENGTHESTLEADAALAARLGARGTPAFFINGRFISGAQPLPRFVSLVEDGIARADAARQRGVPAEGVYAALIEDGANEAVYTTRAPTALRVALPVPDDAPRRGASDPALVVQVFTDFECPFCASVEPTVARLRDAFPQIQWVYRSLPLPFHHDATPAAIAALEVQAQLGDEGFWRMYDHMFEVRGGLGLDALVAHAEAVGADGTRVRRAVQDETHAARVRQDLEAIVETGLRVGTPAFLIGDRVLMGAQPYATFEAAIREELGESAHD